MSKGREHIDYNASNKMSSLIIMKTEYPIAPSRQHAAPQTECILNNNNILRVLHDLILIRKNRK